MSARRRRRCVVALALVAIGASAGAGQATEIKLEPAGEVTLRSVGRVTFGSFITMQCPITLEGTLSRGPITVRSGEQLGALSGMSWTGEQCAGGVPTAVLGLPWTVSLTAVLGGVEAMTGLRLQLGDVSVALEGFAGVDCLYDGDLAALLSVSPDETLDLAWRGGTVQLLPEVTLPRNDEASDFGCPATIAPRGTLTMSATQVRVRQGRPVADLLPIPTGQTVGSVTLRNRAPAGEPSITFTEITLVAVDPRDEPALFEIPAGTNHCITETLPPGGALTCTTNIRYVGGAGVRPRHAGLRIRANDGTNDIVVLREVLAQ